MSYLDVPRLHFAGTFIAKPSTVNNTATNFDPATPTTPPGLVLSWNPNGNHDWQFQDCTVQTAVGKDGTVWNSSNSDPIIGAAVNSTDNPVTAKLVDLDTEQQMVSQIFGLQIKVAISPTDYFVGNFRAISFNDIWARVGVMEGDKDFGAYYQSFLDDVTWSDQLTSPFLQQLQSVSPKQLSIKFVVDGYQDLYYEKNFNQGRIAGTIGPAYENEPPNFVLGRQLRPINFNPSPNTAFSGTPFYFGYAKVDETRQKVVIDLGNSVPTQAPGGPPQELGTLSLAIVPSTGSPMDLGEIDYSLDAYTATAGVQEFSVTAEQLAALKNTPLAVIQAGTEQSGGPVTVLQESPSGAYINAVQPVYRMNPGDVETVELIALQFGEPASGQNIALSFNNSMLQPPNIPPAGANYNVGVPATALTFPGSVPTGADGRATFQLTASDPNNPRQVIDGQVYGVGYSWDLDNLPGFPSDPNTFLSVLVFDAFKEAPTWKNIAPYMMQYAVLYPFMDGLFMLSDPAVYQQNIAAFQAVLKYPITDPRHMPVTRDMSNDKRNVLLAWLAAGAPL